MPGEDTAIHHRRSIRLKGYDYSQSGFYFVTLVAYQRQCLFGEIADGLMHLSNEGEIVGRVWSELPRHFPHIAMGEFVIMPNHLHGVIVIQQGEASAQSKGLHRVRWEQSSRISSQSAPEESTRHDVYAACLSGSAIIMSTSSVMRQITNALPRIFGITQPGGLRIRKIRIP